MSINELETVSQSAHPYFSQVAQTTLAEVPEVSGLAGGVELFYVFRGGGKILNLDFKF